MSFNRENIIRTSDFLLYRNFHNGDILEDMLKITESLAMLLDKECEQTGLEGIEISNPATDRNEVDITRIRALATSCFNRLIELSASHGFSGNLWHTYLTYLCANHENAYSTACEIRGYVDGSINFVAEHDFELLRQLFSLDLPELDKALNLNIFRLINNYIGTDEGKIFNTRVRDRICDLAKLLSCAEDSTEFKGMITDFYKEFGVGKFGLHKAFRIDHDSDGSVLIKPITNIKHVYLEDLVGYEIAKQKLIDNTEAFIEGRPSNNCLLFGDAGTGKSSSIKGILNRYYDKGLRIIEVYKHQFIDLNDVIAQIKSRNYKFILYMDDLSFEDFEVEYKYLKAVIEGGLEKKPSNVLIYATSNRRHIVKESINDRADIREDMHTGDTVQEKLSLSARFGVTIYFGSPSKKEFNNIVKVLADRHKVSMSEEELLLEANKWELSHGGLSGRTAQNFINYLLGKSEEQ